MEQGNSSEKGSITFIRVNVYYSVGVFIIAVLLAVIFIIKAKEKDWYNYLPWLVFALLFIIQAIYSLTGSKYVGLDKQNKKVIIYGFFGIALRKYKYDRLFFRNKELYSEYEGKTKFINILDSQCRKDDLEAFVVEVNKGI
jgi:uncharacterized integral membrane protein